MQALQDSEFNGPSVSANNVAREGGPGDGYRSIRERIKWLYFRRESMLLGLFGVVCVGVAWQLCANYKIVDPNFASSPKQIVVAGYHYVTSSEFRSDGRYTGEHYFIGLILGIAVGVVLGLAMGWNRRIRFFLNFLVSIANATPTIALLPLLVIWLGIGGKTSIAIVFIVAVFPVLVNTMNGIRTVDRTIIEMARSLCVSRWRLFRTILLPAALPSIMSGIRLSIGVGLIGVVVSEFLASSSGIGFMMSNASENFQTAKVFVGLFIIALAGVILTEIARVVEHHFDKWRL